MLLARGVRPYEVPITYKARSREEGKKLTWGDGVVATKILLRVRLRKALTDRHLRPGGPVTRGTADGGARPVSADGPCKTACLPAAVDGIRFGPATVN